MHALRARWVFPVDRPPIQDGVVEFNDSGRIVAVGTQADGLAPGEIRDLNAEQGQDVALIPGLVNAHCHLELSDCQRPFPPGDSFASWIRQVVGWRRNRASPASEAEPPVTRGWREVWETGTTTVGDIAAPGWRREDFGFLGTTTAGSTVSGNIVVFQELLGLPSARIAPNIELAVSHLNSGWSDKRLNPGLSPHAPYTVHPDLFAQVLGLCEPAGIPVAFHLAETTEELQLLAAGTGPLRTLLEDFGAWEPGALPAGGRPLHYIEQMAAAQVRGLVIHGNYLAEDEIALLAAHRDRLSVVYCPRTHAHFGHPRHPWPKLRKAGVTVALGTDSRASNPDLNLWADVLLAASGPGGMSPADALEAATLGGAKALGLFPGHGSLAPVFQAEMAIVPIASRRARDPHELLLEGQPLPLG